MADRPQPPLLGTAWAQAQLSADTSESFDRAIHEPAPATPSLCLDISEFRRHLQRHRKLDDSISLSNRTFLLLAAESNVSSAGSSTQCAQFWRLLTTSWLGREQLIRSCIEIVDESVQTRAETIGRLAAQDDQGAQTAKKRLEAEVYTAELKRRLIHDELAVESAIRKQAFQKFKSRCPDWLFTLPADSPPVQLSAHPTPH